MTWAMTLYQWNPVCSLQDRCLTEASLSLSAMGAVSVPECMVYRLLRIAAAVQSSESYTAYLHSYILYTPNHPETVCS